MGGVGGKVDTKEETAEMKREILVSQRQSACAGTQFTRFTNTEVQILTPGEDCRDEGALRGRGKRCEETRAWTTARLARSLAADKQKLADSSLAVAQGCTAGEDGAAGAGDADTLLFIVHMPADALLMLY